MYDDPDSLSNVGCFWMSNDFDFEVVKKYLIEQYDQKGIPPRSKSTVY
jgi:hypothetical protein